VRRRPGGLTNSPGLLLPCTAQDFSTLIQFVVTATQTITHDAYRATAGGALSAVGEVPVVTFVGRPVTGKPILLLRLGAGVGSSRERSETGLPCGGELRYTTAEAVVYLHGDPLTRTPQIAQITRNASALSV
jgi:hypothetical protein